jgi:PAS domain S-box-containing protein
MQAAHKRFGVIAGFVLLLIVLIANAIVTRRQLAVQLANESWVEHTREVLAGLSRTESLLRTAEAGQRGFLYTEDPQYLLPYSQAISQVEPEVDKLAHLTVDNPNQQQRIPELRALTSLKLQELALSLSIYRAGSPADAKAFIRSNAGLITMEQIRQLLRQMAEEENSLQAERDAKYEKSIGLTIACIYLASILAAIGLLMLAYYIVREINLREKHATQLREREEWFRVTLTSIGEAVIATDENGNVTFLNPLSERLIGRSLAECKGEPIEVVFPIFNEYTHQPVENPVTKVMAMGCIVGLANHTVLKRIDGTLIPIEDSAAPIRDDKDRLCGVVLVFRDATTARKAEEVLRKTEKLATAARLAATVAHEINNPLEAIGNLIYIARLTPGVPAKAAEQLTLAEQELERVSHITRQTLGFYRESKVSTQVELTAIIDSVLRLYTNKLKAKGITVVRDFEDCPPVQGLSGELKQAVSNLIVNAIDAVDPNGTVWLRLACVDGLDGKSAQLKVEDNGPGVAEEHLDHIFEPFFTTKKDVGTGLGLWVTKEIVDRHGGTIQVSARLEDGASGAVFNVQIPCANPASTT